MKWTNLVVMAVLMFGVMYVLMYVMVDIFGNVYANINQFYMAAAMTGAMMLIEMVLMGSMYDRKTKAIVMGISFVVLSASIAGVRGQIAVSDEEFLKSMIPHHGAALLMCERAQLDDPEIKKLCDEILIGQQSEIDWMQSKLSEFK
jgi:uncharacterized protein (DUF305 family)